MKLEKMTEKKFIARSTYEERAIPKTAGFRWDPNQKIWWTDDPKVAGRLRQHATEEATDLINSLLAAKTAAVEASRATDAAIDVPAPDGLAYLPFQRAGIAYASAHPNCLIADEMGLGKTIQAIGLINADPGIQSVLVICPASLKINWQRELTHWLVRPATIGIANGGGLPTQDIVICNYDILKKHRDGLRARAWDLMICDESHYLKNPKTQRTAEVLGKKEITPIAARRRLFLTGTPIVNRPIELWPILHATAPETLGKSCKYHATRYCAGTQTRWGWDVTGASNLDELQEKLRATLMVRRLKKDVLRELPPKRRQVIELPANGAQGAIGAEQAGYAAHEERLATLRAAAELAKAGPEQDYNAAVTALREGAQAAFAEISRLRHDTAVAKTPAVAAHILEALESDGKIVVMAHHHDVINGLSATLTEAQVSHTILTGETSLTDRQAAVDRFQSDATCRVFIGSIQAAGVGITLTASAHVIFAELDWVPGNISQAEDRTHRIGQANSVLVQHLVLEGSLDVTMAHTLVAKQEVIDSALDVAHEARPEPVLPTPEPATAKTSRQKIQEEAADLTPAQITAIHEGLRKLAASCDGAYALDGHGYNKFDAPIGHSLAGRAELTPAQAALGRVLCRKYQRQIAEIWEVINNG